GLAGNDVSRRVQREKAGGDFCLELKTPLEPARQDRRRRQGLRWPDDVPLGADRALLGHITALRWHARRIVASAHQAMVLNASDRTGNPARTKRSQLSRHPADHSSWGQVGLPVTGKWRLTCGSPPPAYFQAASWKIVCAVTVIRRCRDTGVEPLFSVRHHH